MAKQERQDGILKKFQQFFEIKLPEQQRREPDASDALFTSEDRNPNLKFQQARERAKRLEKK